MGREDVGGFRSRRDLKVHKAGRLCAGRSHWDYQRCGDEKVWKNSKIHVNSNGMCGVRLGEIYNLILDALCEH